MIDGEFEEFDFENEPRLEDIRRVLREGVHADDRPLVYASINLFRGCGCCTHQEATAANAVRLANELLRRLEAIS